MITKKEALADINQTQDYYVEKLFSQIFSGDNSLEGIREINFTSPTGTGKTVMIAKLLNLCPDCFFVITSLSRGQLKIQIENRIASLAKYSNFVVYGLSDYTKTTILREEDIIDALPTNKRIIWIRDEGHVATNRWQEVLRDRSYRIINFSATNKNSNGIQCNFTHTMMLRTVCQNDGEPTDALIKLNEIKEKHRCVKGYNPCALFRVVKDEHIQSIIEACERYNLKYINITVDDFDMSELCEDNNEYDVIINKYKITEGIDLKRCHVIYMDSKPGNESTIIQIIGRARRNALFWRDDIDILSEENRDLLEITRECFVYYRIPETAVEQDKNGELLYALCDKISVEDLKPNTVITVENGQLLNGLYILELENKTGSYKITLDKNTGFNIVDNPSFYSKKTSKTERLSLDLSTENLSIRKIIFKDSLITRFKSSGFYSNEIHFKKLTYSLMKKLMLKKNIKLDFDYWENYLDFKNREKDIDRNKFEQFRQSVPDETIFIDATDLKRYSFDFFELEEEYKKATFRVKLENVKLFEKVKTNKKEDAVRLNTQLIKYIDKIECYEWNDIDKITSIKWVEPISPSTYILSEHPLLKNLKDRNINNRYDLDHALSKNKNTFLGISINEWIDLFENIEYFGDLNRYKTKVVGIDYLNKQYNLKIKNSYLAAFRKNEYPTIITNTYNSPIYRIHKNMAEPTLIRWSDLSINVNQIINENYEPYEKTLNDAEIAIIGNDLMRYVGGKYVPDTAVTSKLSKYCKFNSFITRKYESTIKGCLNDCFNGKNNFDFDKKCNSCLGFCVEYFSKIVLFGENCFLNEIREALSETKSSVVSDAVRVKAAIIRYRKEMALCYGSGVLNRIPSISIDSLSSEKYKSFVNCVSKLGKRTARFVQSKMYPNGITDKTKRYDPNLSVDNISALCDYINENTIIDIKVTSSITVQHIKQVLSYHYLSTKRSDLHINKLIVYDAVTEKYVEIIVED